MTARGNLTDLAQNCIIGRSSLPLRNMALVGYGHDFKPRLRDLTQVSRKRMLPLICGGFLGSLRTDSLQA
jgi:hypothetical protein